MATLELLEFSAEGPQSQPLQPPVPEPPTPISNDTLVQQIQCWSAADSLPEAVVGMKTFGQCNRISGRPNGLGSWRGGGQNRGVPLPPPRYATSFHLPAGQNVFLTSRGAWGRAERESCKPGIPETLGAGGGHQDVCCGWTQQAPLPPRYGTAKVADFDFAVRATPPHNTALGTCGVWASPCRW